MICVAASEIVGVMESMGDRLRKARLTKYASANEAAKSIGIPPSTLRAHENGQNEFGAKEAEVYARRFGTTPAYLLTGEAAPQKAGEPEGAQIASAADIRKMLDRIEDLTPENVAVVAAMIDTLRQTNRAVRSRSRSGGRSEFATSRRGS
ncbi:XRE family transcriptional regulator [Mesorhizobium sp. M8A.F.Ca.ET.173.01.1.1]|nr:XRE family transcriptional regulator [Mesorhizobium sp. M8A.F.Ca.ET.173.01.1.1]